MAMKLVKKTDEYIIYQRSDNRYAVTDANKKPINGDDKVRVLVAEELIKVALPAEPEEPVEEEAATESEASTGRDNKLRRQREEAAAEEVVAEKAPAEEAPSEDDDEK